MRVILVGPSPNIENIGLGEFIDSYDIVVRVNTSYLATKTHPNDYGIRNDILYFTCDTTRCHRIDYDLKNNSTLLSNTKFINTLVKSHKGYYKKGIQSKFECIYDLNHEINRNILRNIKEQNTGTKAAIHLLHSLPCMTELYIVGFSFHTDKKPYVMGDINMIYEMSPKIEYGSHNGRNEVDFFLDTVMIDKRVKIHESVKHAINSKSKYNHQGKIKLS